MAHHFCKGLYNALAHEYLAHFGLHAHFLVIDGKSKIGSKTQYEVINKNTGTRHGWFTAHCAWDAKSKAMDKDMDNTGWSGFHAEFGKWLAEEKGMGRREFHHLPYEDGQYPLTKEFTDMLKANRR